MPPVGPWYSSPMRKVVIAKPGGYGRLVLHTLPDPVPGPGEVLLETEAIGVNFADCIVRMGLYASAREYVGWPITPGFDVSGTVTAVGEGVDLPVGAAVFGVVRFGAYSTHVVAPADQLRVRPDALDAVQAAAFPTIFVTAWYALHALGSLRAGEAVLVHSAAGGVGGALVQLAKRAGARVIGVVGGPHKVQVAKDHGADVVIDRSREPLWAAVEAAAPGGLQLVLDANGVATLRESYRHLAPQGRLVVYGFHTMFGRGGRGVPNPLRLAWGWLRTPRFDPLDLTSSNKSVMGFNLSFLFDRTDLLQDAMTDLLDGFEAGELQLPPITTYPLEAVADAHRALETGDTVGKLVLLPDGAHAAP